MGHPKFLAPIFWAIFPRDFPSRYQLGLPLEGGYLSENKMGFHKNSFVGPLNTLFFWRSLKPGKWVFGVARGPHMGYSNISPSSNPFLTGGF